MNLLNLNCFMLIAEWSKYGYEIWFKIIRISFFFYCKCKIVFWSVIFFNVYRYKFLEFMMNAK